MARIHVSDLEDDIPHFIGQRIPAARIDKAFDVGANVGWYTTLIQKCFPAAKIWAFEPVPSIFDEMLGNIKKNGNPSNVTFEMTALGEQNTYVEMTNIPGVTVNKIVEISDHPVITVKVERGDDYCEEHSIHHIDLLKIDAEGHDMKVLLGFGKMLSAEKIDFIQVEAGFSRKNDLHIHFDSFNGLLNSLGYSVLTVKNQSSYDEPRLMWADFLFINDKVSARYK